MQTQKQIECPACKKGTLKERSGKKGSFLGCSNYPECKFTMNMPKEQEIVQPEPSKELKGYHLTPEQVRTNALNAAQVWYPNLQDTPDDIVHFWECVHEFEKYINGQRN